MAESLYDYLEFVRAMYKCADTDRERTLVAAMGLLEETVEFERSLATDELGDCLFYLAAVIDRLGDVQAYLPVARAWSLDLTERPTDPLLAEVWDKANKQIRPPRILTEAVSVMRYRGRDASDIIKKVFAHRRPYDAEMGERFTAAVSDYFVACLHAALFLGTTVQEVAAGNVAKLQGRHPEGWTAASDADRTGET